MIGNFNKNYDFKAYTTENTITSWDDYVLKNKNEDTIGGYFIEEYTPATASDVVYTLEANSLYRDAAPM